MSRPFCTALHDCAATLRSCYVCSSIRALASLLLNADPQPAPLWFLLERRRSRLALSKAPTQAAADPAPADFGFAQPPQQQPGTQPNGPVRMQPAAPNQLAQRLRQATGGAALGSAVAAAAAACGMQGAGTDEDPICLDGAEEEQQAQPGSSNAAAAEGDVAMAAADDGDEGEGRVGVAKLLHRVYSPCRDAAGVWVAAVCTSAPNPHFFFPALTRCLRRLGR